MDLQIETILYRPGGEDLAALGELFSSGNLEIIAAVGVEDEDCLSWLESKGIPVFDDLGDAPRLLPGCLVVDMGAGRLPETAVSRISKHGLLLLDSRLSLVLAGRGSTATETPASGDVFKRFHHLVESYFPTSRHSTPNVKMAACLTEALETANADGGALLLSSPGSNVFAVGAHVGADLPGPEGLSLEDSPLVYRCHTMNRPQQVPDIGSEEGEELFGIGAGSAACVPVRADSEVKGVLLLWSNDAREIWDLEPISVFAYYAAVLMEVENLTGKLEENLLTDPLTGLHNQKQFALRLRQEAQRAERYSLNVSLLVVDVDRLDEYNSACGHMLGNLAISDIASILDKETREVDFVARVGGDEFAVLLPETGRLGALRVADRLRREVEAYPFPVREEKGVARLTVSVGISSMPSAASDHDELLERAYRALQSAMKDGGNSVKLWDEKDG